MLTKEQIDYLCDFCQARGVPYYDMQLELVDHLASAIEKELADHPGWSFQQAVDMVYASFGGDGFAPLVREKRKAAKIYRRRLWWSAFREQLTWPWVWVTVGIFLTSGAWLPLTTSFAGFTVCLICGSVALLAVLIRDGRLGGRRQAQALNRLLLTTSSDSMLTYINTVIVALNLLAGRFHNSTYLLVMGTLNFGGFLTCLAEYRMVLRLQRQVIKDYPNLFKVA